MLTRPLRAPATIAPGASPPSRPRLQVVLFSGGRGSGALADSSSRSARRAHPRHQRLRRRRLDRRGAPVPRRLPRAVGLPQERLAPGRELQHGAALIALIDLARPRLPTRATALDGAAPRCRQEPAEPPAPPRSVRRLVAAAPPAADRAIAATARRVRRREATHRPAVRFRRLQRRQPRLRRLLPARRPPLQRRRRRLLRAPRAAAGLIENVTDGTNAFLVAIDADGALLGSEEEIVDAQRHNRISDIFLIDRPLDARRAGQLPASTRGRGAALLRAARGATSASTRGWPSGSRDADLIIYAPGTQHSSLFPSYLTPGLSDGDRRESRRDQAAGHQHPDRRRDHRQQRRRPDRARGLLPAGKGPAGDADAVPDHALPAQRSGQRRRRAPYVPLGRLESLEDPRLVRVGNYEDGVTGRHDAAKVLAPFIESLHRPRAPVQRVAVLPARRDVGRTSRRRRCSRWCAAGSRDLPVDVTVFHDGADRSTPALRRVAAVPGARQLRDGDADVRARRCATAASTTSCCSSRRACTAARTSPGWRRT